MAWKLTVFAAALLALPALGQDQRLSKFEFTGYYWLPAVRGAVRSGSTSIDLRSDLSIEQNRLMTSGRFTLKPGRRHRMVIAGAPYRLRGVGDLPDGIEFNSSRYVIGDTLRSEADILYLFGGYQFDASIQRSHHVGIEVGAAYLRADARVRSLVMMEEASEVRQIALPLVGIDLRKYFARRRLSISGEAKGMTFGKFGRFAEGGVHLGFRIRNVTLQGGYALLHFNIRNSSGSIFFRPTLVGPAFSVHVGAE